MEKEEKLRSIGSTALAFVGDAVYTLYVRERLSMSCDYKSGLLTQMASKLISATSQAQILQQICDALTPDEEGVVRRARNTRTNNKAKNASFSVYHKATSFEALIGWLHLKGETDRLTELLGPAVGREAERLLLESKGK